MFVIDPYDRHEPQHITIRGGSSVPLRAERAHVRGRPGRLLSQLYGLRALARAACSEFGSLGNDQGGRGCVRCAVALALHLAHAEEGCKG